MQYTSVSCMKTASGFTISRLGICCYFQFLGKTPIGVLPYCHRVRRPASLSSSSLFVQSEAVIYLMNSFDVESPNFTGTPMPTGPTFASDMTSLTTSGRRLQRKKKSKMPPQTALGQILVAWRFASPPIGGLLVALHQHNVTHSVIWSLCELSKKCIIRQNTKMVFLP